MPAERTAADVVLLAPALEGSAALAAEAAPPPSADDAPTRALAALAGDPSTTVSFAGETLPSAPWESRLMVRLGLAAPPTHGDAEGRVPGAEIPAARLLRPTDLAAPADGAERSSGDGAASARSAHAVIADPVSLVPGRDEATLLPPETLALSDTEAREFVAAAASLLADEALTLERGASGRWYLSGLDADVLAAPPTHFVAHREAGAWLPPGAAARRWRRLTAELEMLWHAHPRNAERRARGLAPLNGVWFWGGAVPPAPPTAPPSLTLATRDPLALALGRHAGVGTRELGPTARLDALLAASAPTTLVIVDLAAHEAWLARDAARLAEAVEAIAERWLRPGLRALGDGRAASLVVESGDAHRTRIEARPSRGWLGRLLGTRRRRAAAAGDGP